MAKRRLRKIFYIRLIIKILNRLMLLAALVILCFISFNFVWNLGHYSGKVAGEAGVLLFQQELMASIEQGYTFRWHDYRFVPARTRRNGLKNVITSKITSTVKEDK